jgi:DNA (cytosine-5)-methyltransferase 1
MMTIGSLCSGYGGLDRAAVAALGGPHQASLVWHAEVDSDAIKVHDRHWPGLPNVTDIRAARWPAWERPDALVMGPPCQPVSAAGRQMAEDDPRWLWPAAHRAVKDLDRPPLVFFENVRNLISIRGGEVWRGILADLRALGYACRWLVLGACAIGAPHHRHRVFMVARHMGADAPPAERVNVETCGARRGQPATLLPSPAARDGDGRGEGDEAYWRQRETERTNGRPLAAAVTLLPTPQAREARDGSATLSAETGARRMASGRRNLDDAISLLPTEVRDDRWGKYAPAVERWVPIIGRPAPEPTELGPRGGLRLAPELPEWMMGLAAGYLCDHVERNPALRLAGNGVVPLQGYRAFRILLDGWR